MISSANEVPPGHLFQADICIVGAGAAGISLALALADSGLEILLLEAGFARPDAATQDLYRGEVVDDRLHSPPDKYRQRRFGGSTTIWGGRCMPFDPIDFEKRPYLPGSGWPISYDELLPYYIEANRLCEAGDFEYDADRVFDPQGQAMFKGFSSATVQTRSLERFSCPTDFATRYGERLRVAPNISVILGANCAGIRLSASNPRVESLEFASLQGRRFTAKAQAFVLATGGMEVPRLLLASTDTRPLGIGNENDLVGRNYMCHLAGNVGTLTIAGPTDQVRHGYERSAEGVYCRRRLSLDPDEQRRLGTGNMVARLHFPRISDPSHGNGVLSGLFMAKHFISYEYGKRLHDGTKPTLATYLGHLANIVCDPWDTSAFAYHWLSRRTLADRKFPSVILRNRTNRFSLEVHSEQIPNPESRITLSRDRDRLGMPQVKVDWRYLPQDVVSVRRTLDAFARAFEASRVGRFDFDPESLERDLARFGAYGGHHIGTTRMGSDPNTSVVDRHCRLHSVSNLFIASSSVFATSSQANPTLTIVALALRLAAHLRTALSAPSAPADARIRDLIEPACRAQADPGPHGHSSSESQAQRHPAIACTALDE